MNFYVYAILAVNYRVEGTGANVGSIPGACSADDETHAKSLAYSFGLEMLPPSEGWIDHSISVALVPFDVLQRVVDHKYGNRTAAEAGAQEEGTTVERTADGVQAVVRSATA